MSLEAAAGKDPVTHVGKIYNVVAREIAEALITNIQEIIAAECLLVSRIGYPLAEPAVTQIKIATLGGAPASQFESRVEEVALGCLAGIPGLVEQFIAGEVTIF